MKKLIQIAEQSPCKKNTDQTAPEIKFNLSPNNLDCFKGKMKTSKVKLEQMKTPEKKKTESKELVKLGYSTKSSVKEKSHQISPLSSFDQKVVFMHYGNFDVYIDNSTRKKSRSQNSKKSNSKGKKDDYSDCQADILSSCLRVITQETDNTSNALSKSAQLTPQGLTPRAYNNPSRFNNSQLPSEKQIRNKRSVTNQESKNFTIFFDNIEIDGRTTIMVKNIPNKYTQDTLLQDFCVNHKNQFDFFYLPIDKDNDCNIGYCFVNFINTSFIKQFYSEFHNKKWRKYKSPKICQLYYARYQGTLELAHHFQHTKILGKQKKLRPLIGLCESNKIKQMIENQRIRQ